MTSQLPRYDIQQTYRWNYDHPPNRVELSLPGLPGEYCFAGLPATGPMGIAAGPLLNGKWILYYASLGFDVLTYKTVRSSFRPCYPLPNLVHVRDHHRHDVVTDAVTSDEKTSSWAVSFGMPSMEPSVWRGDIEATRRQLEKEKLLNVSVVGTIQRGWTIDDLADDYARCARWAVQSGADTIEANLSCPNVNTCDGQLYQRPEEAGVIAQAIRQAIGKVPLILKIGHVVDTEPASALLAAVCGQATAIAMTNSIAGRVRTTAGDHLFEGDRRGICGQAILGASCDQVSLFARLIGEMGSDMTIIGVGGAATANDVNQYLSAGAHCVHLATAAMLDPSVAIKIKGNLSLLE